MSSTISEAIPATGPGRPRKTRADLQREYVAGTGAGYASFLRTLPRWIEDIDRDFGEDIVQRMRLDPAYSSCITLLKLAILARGLDVLPAVGGSDPEHARAVEFADFCKRQLNGLTTPFVAHTLFNLLDCLDHGNKVAEIVYTYPEIGPDKGKLGLKAVKVKPRRALSFVVDAYLNIVGLLAAIPGQTATTAYVPGLGGLLPRRKFLILSCRPVDEDPRGTNLGRPAYHAWWFKAQAWGEWLKTLATFAGGNIIGKTPSGAESTWTETDDGEQLETTPESVMVGTLENLRNGSVIALPAESEVQIERPEGDVGEAFQAAIDTANREVTQGILMQTRATMEAQHGSKADSETGQDALNVLVAHEKTAIEQALRCDLFMSLIELNFGAEWLYLTPRATLGETTEEDLAPLMLAVAQLSRSGYLDPEQLPETDARLGLPIRSAASVERRRNAPPAAPASGSR